jgi:uncharacterized protein
MKHWRHPTSGVLSAIVFLLAGASGRFALADTVADLYEAQAIVTGQREPERVNAIPSCLEDVLVKVSGDPRLVSDPRLLPLQTKANEFVSSFHYHDRMAGIPVHDEQGTRDRPYDLYVDFDRRKIDGALRSLGLTPWLERPRLAAFVKIEHGAARFLLTRDGARGLGQRLSLLAAASKRGLSVGIPTTAMLANAGLAEADPVSEPRGFEGLTRDLGDVALLGRLAWVEQNLGWTAEWQLTENVNSAWRVRASTFDAVFRNGIEGSAQVLSGHGAPQ